MENNLKILKAEVKSFQNIDFKQIDLGGKSMVIIGKNGQGKSSLINAICSPLDSKMIPSKAIKEGEERASVELVVGGVKEGEKVRYTIDIYFSPEHEKGRLVAKDSEGAVIKSKSVIQSIVGQIGFDIMSFINKGVTAAGKVSATGVKEQVETLFQFLTDEQKKNIRDTQADIKKIKDDRTFLNKKIKESEVDLKNNQFTEEEIEKHKEEIPAESIQKELSKVNEKITEHDRIETGVVDKVKEAEKHLIEIKSLEKKVQELLDEASKGKKWLSKNDKPSPEDISKKLQEANDHNAKHKEIEEYKAKHNKVQNNKKEYKELGKKATSKQKEIAKIFSESSLPVDELTFDEDQVLYKGLPFNYDHHSHSEIMIVGAKIAMAMNPNLRTIFIKDGSLLDKDNLKVLVNLCDEMDYQLLIELVDFDGGELHVEFAESYLEQ
jgi:DNA repair exonuclease SbcCD ATPase subunit